MRTTSLISLLLFAVHGQGQSVTNVTAEQQGQDLVVSYALEADGPVGVNLFVSTDQGKSWQGPLSNCSGDVGGNVAAGGDKRIRWAVLQERELVGDGIRFKVVTKSATKKLWLNPNLSYGSVTDIDGNMYATIQIGQQVWMAENLRTSRYRNGDPIPNVTDGDAWTQLKTGAWAHYINDSQYEQPYGKLYNWHTVADPRKVCPVGWHVPVYWEWTTLFVELEGGAGGKMKATSLWDEPNAGATNESGFAGLPGGGRHLDGSFSLTGRMGYWWMPVENEEIDQDFYFLQYDSDFVDWNRNDRRCGFSLRCVRD